MGATHIYRCKVTCGNETLTSGDAIVTVNCLHPGFREDGHCTQCGEIAMVKVTADGAVSWYAEFDAAWNDVSKAQTAEITLFRDTVSKAQLEVPQGAEFTLNMANGAKLTITGGYILVRGRLTAEHCTISSSSNGVPMEVASADSGEGASAVFTDCNFQAAGMEGAAIFIWNASADIYSGTFTGTDGADGLFGPDDNITREQLAVILWRCTGSPSSTGTLEGFTDAGSVSPYAVDALRWAVENKIVGGKGDGILDPSGNATRAETAAMLMQYCDNLK